MHGVLAQSILERSRQTGVQVKPLILLRSKGAAIQRVVEAHQALNPRVFGSIALGTDTLESDIDLLVDPTSVTTLMDIGAIRLELRQLLGVPVDVLTPNALPEIFKDRVLADALPLSSFVFGSMKEKLTIGPR